MFKAYETFAVHNTILQGAVWKPLLILQAETIQVILARILTGIEGDIRCIGLAALHTMK